MSTNVYQELLNLDFMKSLEIIFSPCLTVFYPLFQNPENIRTKMELLCMQIQVIFFFSFAFSFFILSSVNLYNTQYNFP